MDFAWTPEAEALRAEVRAFLAEHLTPELEERMYETGVAHDDDFIRALGDRHWIAPEWPRDGFEPMSAECLHVLSEEITKADAPIYAASTATMVGRVIQRAGSQALQDELLPKVATGEITIALGMSEPEAGSDVAAVQTRGRQVEGGWIIDGQKMFTTNGHLTDYVFLLVRTDPDSERHHGLTTFVVPMDLEGIEAQAVYTISGERTNITFYSDVFVEDRWRISEVGAGWQSLMLALQDEHSAPFGPHLTRIVEAAERWASTPDADGAFPLARDEVRLRLVDAAIDDEVAKLLEARTSWMEGNGQVPLVEGPMGKLFSTEAIARRAEDLAALTGPDGLRSREDPTTLAGGLIEHGLRFSLGTTIYAGSSEVQRNIIAQHGCKLPRG